MVRPTRKSVTESGTTLLTHLSRAGVALCIVTGFYYLTVLNRVSTRGFVLEEIKAERVRLMQELEEREISVTIPSSVYGLRSLPQYQDMASVGDRTYWRVSSTAGEVAVQIEDVYTP